MNIFKMVTLLFIILIFATCQKVDVSEFETKADQNEKVLEPEEENKLAQLNDKLLGKWIEYFPLNSSRVMEFVNSCQFTLTDTFDSSVVNLNYELISDNSMKIDHPIMIPPNIESRTHNYELIRGDTLIIYDFYEATFETETGYVDTKLYKIN